MEEEDEESTSTLSSIHSSFTIKEKKKVEEKPQINL